MKRFRGRVPVAALRDGMRSMLTLLKQEHLDEIGKTPTPEDAS